MDDSKIRVLIADDHSLWRQGLRHVLNLEEDIEVVAEAADGEEALQVAQETQPDIVLMDVRMPKLAGIEAARRLKELLPATRVVMLTVSDEEHDLFEAIKAGASGYLLKEIEPSEIAKSLRLINQGQAPMSPSMAGKLLNEFAQMSRKTDERAYSPPPLTNRELEVLKLAADGLSNREIGGKLFISENTVKNHIRNILEKLQLHSRMEAVLYAMREKLLDLEKRDDD